MASEVPPSAETESSLPRPPRVRLPRPGLAAIALIGATTWLFAVWIGPWLVPGPRPAPEPAASHTATTAPAAPISLPDTADAVPGIEPASFAPAALAVVPEPPEPEPTTVSRVVSVRTGDTLAGMLARADVAAADAHAAIAALRKVFDPRALRPGTDIALTFETASVGDGAATFQRLELSPSIHETVGVARTEEGRFESFKAETTLTRAPMRASGTISSSLYVDAVALGVPVPIVVELIRAMSFDVDFQRDIQPDDRFDLLYERLLDPEGNPVGAGNVLFASLTLSGKHIPIYRFRGDDGFHDYFNPKGESTRRTLMRTPIDGARLSSRFGNRRHPILGYTTMHRGIDFAAPTGTPIMAAGHGTVAEAGWNGGYGRYIRIRHNATYSTAYAHLDGFARGIRRGARVSQGQVIGYVGTTGRSTGPHLHYEVLVNNTQVNPLSVKLPTGRTLEGAERKRFLAHRAEIDAVFEGQPVIAGGDDDRRAQQATRRAATARGAATPTEPLGMGGP